MATAIDTVALRRSETAPETRRSEYTNVEYDKPCPKGKRGDVPCEDRGFQVVAPPQLPMQPAYHTPAHLRVVPPVAHSQALCVDCGDEVIAALRAEIPGRSGWGGRHSGTGARWRAPA